MNLLRTVDKFCNATFVDAYSSYSFMGSIDPFRDTTRSSSNTERRILNTLPDTVIPARQVVSVDGCYFIIADKQTDHYKGAKIRNKYTVAPVKGQIVVQSISDLVNSLPGVTDIYGLIETSSYLSIRQESSDVVLKTTLVISPADDVLVDSIVTFNGRQYRSTADSFVDGVGFRLVEILDLGANAIRTINVSTQGARDLVTELPTDTSFTGVLSLSCLSELFYQFVTADMKPIEAGDRS